MRFLKMIWATIRQFFKGIEIVEIVPGLYQSSKVRWPWDELKLKRIGIDVVIDLQGRFDIVLIHALFPWLKHYLYWPIKDAGLPNVKDLESVAEFGMRMIWENGHKIVVHCAAGYNRSGLVNGVILWKHGISGGEAIRLIRQARPGALNNPTFASYIATLPGGVEPPTNWKRRRVSRGKDFA